MESSARRAFLTGRRAAQTPWEDFLRRLRRRVRGRVFDFNTSSGSARLVPEDMADVHSARVLCQEFGIRLALDGVQYGTRMDDRAVLWVEPGVAMSRFERLSDGDPRWFVQPGCLLGDLEEAGLRQFKDLPCHLTVAAWLADREWCDWDAGCTADSGLVHASVLLNDGTQGNLGAFGEASHKPLGTARLQQLIPQLFELSTGDLAGRLGGQGVWPARYRLDALTPRGGGTVNLAHLLLGHGGDLGWVEWVVLDERAAPFAQRPYHERYFRREPGPDAERLDRQVKLMFDALGIFPDPGQSL